MRLMIVPGTASLLAADEPLVSDGTGRVIAGRQPETLPATSRLGSAVPGAASVLIRRSQAPAGTRPRPAARVAVRDAIKRIANGRLRCWFREHVFVSHEVELLKACKHCGRVERDGPMVGTWIP